jgi:CRP/FNR family transcriptional regulator, anaerobic regulatory protein
MNDNLIKHIRKYIDLSDSESLILSRYVKQSSYKKKEFVLQENNDCKNLFFVEKGCLRMYFINEKAVEQIVQFALDGWWISDLKSFINKTPSDYYIQTIENSNITAINSEALEQLLKELPKLERYFRIIMQQELAAAQFKSKLMYGMSKEDFYNHFISSFPQFVQRVPQYMIASYLGLTPEYVSGLRKKKL